MDAVDSALLLLRVVLGVVIAAHGLNKVRGGAGLQGTANWFGSIGMRHPMLQARLAASTEIVAGVALVAGLLTPVATAAIVGLMVVAIRTVHGKVGFFIFLPGGGWEYCAVLAATAISISLSGPGSISLDAVFDLPLGGLGSMLVAAGGGFAAAVIQLMLFHRPDRTPR